MRPRELQAHPGRTTAGMPSAASPRSRCTNEETFLVQKLVRAAFGNNNVDTCARVCHSPTGYGLKTTFGTSAGTQDFDSVDEADVILVIGANPTDGHPVFASRMKKRLRQGARLIVVDPRRIDLVRTPHVEADYHLPAPARHQRGADQRPGACHRHRGPGRRGLSSSERCDPADFARWARLRRRAAQLRPRRPRPSPACRPARSAPPPGSMPPAATPRSTTASASPSTARARPW